MAGVRTEDLSENVIVYGEPPGNMVSLTGGTDLNQDYRDVIHRHFIDPEPSQVDAGVADLNTLLAGYNVSHGPTTPESVAEERVARYSDLPGPFPPEA